MTIGDSTVIELDCTYRRFQYIDDKSSCLTKKMVGLYFIRTGIDVDNDWLE